MRITEAATAILITMTITDTRIIVITTTSSPRQEHQRPLPRRGALAEHKADRQLSRWVAIFVD